MKFSKFKGHITFGIYIGFIKFRNLALLMKVKPETAF